MGGGRGKDLIWTDRPDQAFMSFTCGEIFNPVGVRTHSLELSVVYVPLITSFDGWLVDSIEDVEHIQVCVIMAEQVPAGIQATRQTRPTVLCYGAHIVLTGAAAKSCRLVHAYSVRQCFLLCLMVMQAFVPVPALCTCTCGLTSMHKLIGGTKQHV